MSNTTQDGRLLSISTPLGKDFLLLERITAREGLSMMFDAEVELLHEEDKSGTKPTVIDPTSILGQTVTVTFRHRDKTERTMTGIVNNFAQGDRNIRYTSYYATIVPHIWILTQRFQSRIFQHKNVLEILEEVLKGFDVSFEVQGDFKPRNYCVQYYESDFDFASRLMEEEGIFYFFEHESGKDTLVIANTPQSHRDCPGKSEVEYYLKVLEKNVFVSSIRDLRVSYRLQTGKFAEWDRNFQLPTNKLQTEQPSLFNVGGNQSLERYEFPGGYARKYDGIDSGGGERPSDLQNIFPDKQRTIENRMGELDAGYRTIDGEGVLCTFTGGCKFELKGHPNADYNRQYVIKTIVHHAQQNPGYTAHDEIPDPYTNYFTCLMHGAGQPPFVPERKTPKPIVKGSQTATVVGPAGEEIFTDKYGRIKVQFHWDRHGQNDPNSSCWMRVIQPWAGKNWGSICIPRIGHEVIVEFLEGDPDQPIVSGSVYNPSHMPPYTLPENANMMGFKSDTTPGSGGYNEIAIVDGKAGELIRIHAQKDMDTTVENDDRQYVVANREIKIDGKRDQTVKGNMSTTVTEGDQSNVVKAGKQNNVVQEQVVMQSVAEGISILAKQLIFVESSEMIVLQVKGSSIAVTPDGIELKIGGSSITLDKSNIVIKSPTVNINP